MVTSIRSLVEKALSIVNISVLRGASFLNWVAWIGQVQENETSAAFTGTWTSTHNVGVSSVIVSENVVGTTIWQLSEETSKISSGIEGVRSLLVVKSKKLLQIKDLNVMIEGLTGNDEVVLVGSDFSPSTGWGSSSLGKSAEVAEFTSTGDLWVFGQSCFERGSGIMFLTSVKATPSPWAISPNSRPDSETQPQAEEAKFGVDVPSLK